MAELVLKQSVKAHEALVFNYRSKSVYNMVKCPFIVILVQLKSLNHSKCFAEFIRSPRYLKLMNSAVMTLEGKYIQQLDSSFSGAC